MNAAVSITKEGRRHYLVGLPYALKDAARDAGCKWDADRRAWWTAKPEKAAEIAAMAAAPAPAPAQGAQQAAAPNSGLSEDSKVEGRGTVNGKPCLIVWRGTTARGPAAKLASLDGKRVWWADPSTVTVTKLYHPTRSGFGRYAREEPMTFGRLCRLREKFKREQEARDRGEAPPGWRPCGYPGCHHSYCDECDGEGLRLR